MKEENNDKIQESDNYTESHGTGVVSSLIFMVVAVILMILLSHYMGN